MVLIDRETRVGSSWSMWAWSASLVRERADAKEEARDESPAKDEASSTRH